MLLSVVIPVLNAAATLPKCLDGLAAQVFTDAELILVDNGSNDESIELVRQFVKQRPELKVRLIEEVRPGASAARNKGASLAVGDWLVFTDSDCVADPDWLADLADAIRAHSEVAAFAGTVTAFPANSCVGRFTGLFTLPPNMGNTVYDRFELLRGGFPSANLTIRRDLFEQLGGFDASIRIYGEDYDLCRRVYESGNRIMALAGARTKHIHRETLLASLTQAFGFGRSHALLLGRMPDKPFILTGPLIRLLKPGWLIPVWLDVNQADKKLIVLAVAGLLWWPLWLAGGVYIALLTDSLRSAAVRRGIRLSVPELAAFPALMVLKAGAMTCGRLLGSFRFKVICV